MVTSEKEASVFDFFISYKRKDSSSFVERLASSLKAFEAEVCLDKQQLNSVD